MRRAALGLIPACALVVVLGAHRHGRAERASADLENPFGSSIKPTRDPEGLHSITVGLYLQNIPEIDIKSNSFSAEFYLWFLWNGDIDPTLSYQLTNAVGVAELTRTPVYADAAGNAVAVQLADGGHYQLFHVHGRFNQPFPLGRYPFDEHDLVISVEDAKHAVATLQYAIDNRESSMRPDLSIPGFCLSAMRAKQALTHYPTNFGDPRFPGGSESYSRVDFKVHIVRPMVGLLSKIVISKIVIPIALIILITFGAFFCQPQDIDARLCLTITALISAVALQFTASTELPPTGYLVLLDEIYIVSYVVILGVSFFAIAANRLAHAERPDAARRLDRAGLWLFGGGFFGALALLVATR